MSEIIDEKLFLGDITNANDIEFLNDNNITTIICVAKDVKIEINDKNIVVYQFDLTDDDYCNITQHFNDVFHIIETSNVVLINCIAGISRSPTIVIAYLMKYYNLSLHLFSFKTPI